MLFKPEKLLNYFDGDFVLISYPFDKIKLVFIAFIYLLISLNPLMALEKTDFLMVDILVRNCFEDIKSCDKALLKIHKYQKNAAISKKFSCQTRLLGLEANLIMAMNSNFKKNDSKSIIDSIKKYC